MQDSERKESPVTGWVEKLPSGRWRACWRDPEGRRKSKTFATQREAKQHLRATQVAMDKGAYVDDGLAKVRFGDWAEHYFKVQGKRLSRKSLDRDLTFLNAYILPKWGGVQLGKITAPAVEAWIADMGEEGAAVRVGTLAAGTVEKIYQIFSKVIRAAHRDGRLLLLPLPRQLPIPRKPKRKAVRFLTEVEVAQLASTIEQFYEALIYIAAYGGFRVGELAALRLDDVDWERGTIRVDEAVTDVSGMLEFEEPKTGRGRRRVPMADFALDKLRTHVEDEIGWSNRGALLFPSRDRTTLRINNWRGRYFEPAVRTEPPRVQ
jgi:integrase